MNDSEKIQGTWLLVSADRNGQAIPKDITGHIRLVFDGENLHTRNKDRVTTAQFRLNSDETPTQIDLDMDGQVGRGIYDLQGDRLKIVHGEIETSRPTEFSAHEGSNLTLMVLNREIP